MSTETTPSDRSHLIFYSQSSALLRFFAEFMEELLLELESVREVGKLTCVPLAPLALPSPTVAADRIDWSIYGDDRFGSAIIIEHPSLMRIMDEVSKVFGLDFIRERLDIDRLYAWIDSVNTSIANADPWFLMYDYCLTHDLKVPRIHQFLFRGPLNWKYIVPIHEAGLPIPTTMVLSADYRTYLDPTPPHAELQSQWSLGTLGIESVARDPDTGKYLSNSYSKRVLYQNTAAPIDDEAKSFNTAMVIHYHQHRLDLWAVQIHMDQYHVEECSMLMYHTLSRHGIQPGNVIRVGDTGFRVNTTTLDWLYEFIGI